MTKYITVCDNCGHEFNKDNYGTNGELTIKYSHTDSMTERFECEMDLCYSCFKKVDQAISKVLKSELRYKMR